MDPTELAYCSLDELGALLRRRSVSPVEIVQTAIERTERLDPALGAYITFTPDAALTAARLAEREIVRGTYRGPLHGVPFAVKDQLWTAGLRTTFGSRAYADLVPTEDASAVARLRAAGAVLMGKTNLPAYCWAPNFRDHAYAVPRNPWSLEHFPGISSPGSASAVAAGLVYTALGTDTGGSIRQPAAYCGVAGLKPTYGRVSRHGMLPLGCGLDHVGPLARSVRDCAIVLDALAGPDPRDPDTLDDQPPAGGWAAALVEPIRPLRLGVPRAYFWEAVQPDVARVAEAALAVWLDLGWPIREVALPPMGPIVAAAETVELALTGAEYGELIAARPDEQTPELSAQVEAAGRIRAIDYLHAHRTGRAFGRALAEVFREIDVLVTPTRGGGAPRMAADGGLLEQPWRDGFRGVFNLPGVPAMSIPAGFDDRGLPLGVQLVGPRLGEAAVFVAGQAFQSATDWHRRRPPLDAAV